MCDCAVELILLSAVLTSFLLTHWGQDSHGGGGGGSGCGGGVAAAAAVVDDDDDGDQMIIMMQIFSWATQTQWVSW